MCAINGFNFKDECLVLKMNRATSHRGPDGTGVFVDDNITLGHNRLSIIDLSDSASQPMKLGDGNLRIVFNGEIYNFQELKKELSSYPFKTKSDTEVILASYKKWGSGCVKKFNGIFSFAIWDNVKQELFLARDQMGVKPFYYFWDGNRFIFSSEIKAILEHDVPRNLNKDAFNHYLRVLYVPEPLTMFDGIKKLPPANYAILRNNELTIYKYWEVARGSYLKESRSEIASMLQDKVDGVVNAQLISDRPLGIYLSGGIDSSVILDSVSQVRDKIDTFSVGFELSKKDQSDKFNADFYLARRTAKHYGTCHNEILLSPQDVLDNFEQVVWQMDEPISNPTSIAMMKLAKFTKNKVDVVLGGDGGDELFGGYERYRLSLLASYYQKLPSSLRRMASKLNKKAGKLNTPSGVDRFALFMFQKNNILERSVGDNFLNTDITKKFFEKKYFSNIDDRKFEEVFMNIDRKSWLVDFSLILTDKMSMSGGIEIRVPLLDRELVEFASKIPLKYKINPYSTKIILKDAFRDRIPDFLFDQPKRGWFSPAAKWLRDECIYNLAKNILADDYYEETAKLFKLNEVRRILDNHKDSKEYNLNIIWAILTFQIWAKQYKIRIQ